MKKTAVFEFLQRPVIDQLFQFDVADGRILDFDQPLDIAQAFQRHVRCWVGDLNRSW